MTAANVYEGASPWLLRYKRPLTLGFLLPLAASFQCIMPGT